MNTRKIIVQQHSKWQKNKCHKNECHILRGNEEQLVENIHTLIWNIIHVWKITEGKYQKITQTECRAQSQTCGIELIFFGILSWKLHFAFIFGRNFLFNWVDTENGTTFGSLIGSFNLNLNYPIWFNSLFSFCYILNLVKPDTQTNKLCLHYTVHSTNYMLCHKD